MYLRLRKGDKNMKITKKMLTDLDKEIKEETKNIKRRTFLMATRNRYSKLLGIKPPYTW